MCTVQMKSTGSRTLIVKAPCRLVNGQDRIWDVSRRPSRKREPVEETAAHSTKATREVVGKLFTAGRP
jgi:hypothetical protein